MTYNKGSIVLKLSPELLKYPDMSSTRHTTHDHNQNTTKEITP